MKPLAKRAIPAHRRRPATLLRNGNAFTNMTFSCLKSDKPVLPASLPAGYHKPARSRSSAPVGANKTTMGRYQPVPFIVLFREPNSGMVLLLWSPGRHQRPDLAAGLLGIVLQDVDLFTDLNWTR